MKKICLLCAILLLLSGCANQNDRLQQGMKLRDRLMRETCRFTADITADYGDYSYSFTMECSTDDKGSVLFSVRAPESITGISGKLTPESGFLTFEDTALAFPLLADGEVTPVSAPWLLISTLRGGYLLAAGEDGQLCRLTFHDSYEEDALQVDVWLNEENLPLDAEILWQGRRVLSIHIEDFVFV